jgi:predicted metal-dependent HD superfamily phosphohydrolase
MIADKARFLALWNRVGSAGDPVGTFERLARAYHEPTRHYHNADHIRDCLEQLDRERGLAQEPDAVEFALWFHDAVYRPSAGDNEERSAAWADEALSSAGAPESLRTRVRSLVLATRHGEPAVDPDERLISDVDLSILGREPSVFDEFERRIRQEYSWVPAPLYRVERGRMLRRFLARDPLYLTSPFRERYEASAKRNLARVLDHTYPPEHPESRSE